MSEECPGPVELSVRLSLQIHARCSIGVDNGQRTDRHNGFRRSLPIAPWRTTQKRWKAIDKGRNFQMESQVHRFPLRFPSLQLTAEFFGAGDELLFSKIQMLIIDPVGAQKDFESFLDSVPIDRSAGDSPGFNLKEKSRQTHRALLEEPQEVSGAGIYNVSSTKNRLQEVFNTCFSSRTNLIVSNTYDHERCCSRPKEIEIARDQLFLGEDGDAMEPEFSVRQVASTQDKMVLAYHIISEEIRKAEQALLPLFGFAEDQKEVTQHSRVWVGEIVSKSEVDIVLCGHPDPCRLTLEAQARLE
ncbi:hypothetical protein PGT21_006642 [Puccinia graminis f. sp. tritici]|uniref:Uncharacterized protein n=1 Tax=Puccinia graminis f. sp. tritici TaxID=56615 RepID=A0A5B0MWA7_PUCGR|nr:hypothetical protein PGT21_006642 [Puccinia graminis f. sp. tritici]KAA1120466.1 hypothetical protein PGTUg99_021551 [Puccinia graminis f. sp. tritici]